MQTTTVYVLEPDPVERSKIESALAAHVGALVFIDSIDALPARRAEDGACLIVSAEHAQEAVESIREIRRRGNLIAVIALGPHAAFRSAIDIARMDATDFLERPLSARELRRAVRGVAGR